MSRRIVFRFGEKCAYKHKLIITSQSLDNHEIHEDDKDLMLEVDFIKKYYEYSCFKESKR